MGKVDQLKVICDQITQPVGTYDKHNPEADCARRMLILWKATSHGELRSTNGLSGLEQFLITEISKIEQLIFKAQLDHGQSKLPFCK